MVKPKEKKSFFLTFQNLHFHILISDQIGKKIESLVYNPYYTY